ncbi:MAG: endonuclease/exonuclease/phosphatase family protein [Alistipes sp.]|nr:endonuclease/exonuclease/phosphatase family protein [Alistipes sp.]
MIRLKASLLAALVALVALSSCSNPSNEWHEQKVRVMSYNVHNCRGTDGVRDYARVAGVISKYDPDLVAIQEVDSMTSRQKRDVTAQLAARTGYYGYFAPAIPHTGGKYGVAILSKKPVLSIR